MARQRFIWPDLWTDPGIGVLAPLERLLFIGLFSLADDEGRIDGSPAYLKAAVFPYDPFTVEEVETLRNGLVDRLPNVVLYQTGSEQVIALARWSDHQKPKYARPSKFPPPPGKPRKQRVSKADSGKPPGKLPEDSGNVPGTLGERSGKPPGTFREAFPRRGSVGSKEQGQDLEQEQEQVGKQASTRGDQQPPAPPPLPDLQTVNGAIGEPPAHLPAREISPEHDPIIAAGIRRHQGSGA